MPVLKKKFNDYVVTISIKHADGIFRTQTTGTAAKETIIKASQEITEQIQQWLSTRFSYELDGADWNEDLPTERTSKQLEKKLEVLVVDDDVETITPLLLCLEKMDCNIKIVNNGYDAINEIVSQDSNYELVILDWMMPEMSGEQAILNAQRVLTYTASNDQGPSKQQTPVVVYSSKARDEIDWPPCKNFSYYDHWEKPSSYLDLLNKASDLVTNLKTEGPNLSPQSYAA